MKTISFADKLQKTREAAGLSQYALAKKTGLSKQSISSLEIGNREPTWATVQLIAAALGVSCEDFTDPTLTPPEPAPTRPRGRPRKAEADGGAKQKRKS